MTETSAPAAVVASPCINVCRIDAASQLCLGCARTLDEIARWSQAPNAERQRIVDLLPARRAQLGWPASGPRRMKRIRFYYDPISPYAALAFWRLPELLAGRSVVVDYIPILFAALLKAYGTKGPAEIAPKRAWTYRQIAWLAHQQGVDLQMPAEHPFNPLPLLRQAWACAPEGLSPSRWVAEQLFAHVWQSGGAKADEPARLAELAATLAPQQRADDETAKQRLREATDAALAAGVFGVPSFEVDGRLFWGQDALPMLAAFLDGDTWFQSGAWDAALHLPVGIHRKT